jgi:hypothetical protein
MVWTVGHRLEMILLGFDEHRHDRYNRASSSTCAVEFGNGATEAFQTNDASVGETRSYVTQVGIFIPVLLWSETKSGETTAFLGEEILANVTLGPCFQDSATFLGPTTTHDSHASRCVRCDTTRGAAGGVLLTERAGYLF